MREYFLSTHSRLQAWSRYLFLLQEGRLLCSYRNEPFLSLPVPELITAFRVFDGSLVVETGSGRVYSTNDYDREDVHWHRETATFQEMLAFLSFFEHQAREQDEIILLPDGTLLYSGQVMSLAVPVIDFCRLTDVEENASLAVLDLQGVVHRI
jgi:hypothetical protein